MQRRQQAASSPVKSELQLKHQKVNVAVAAEMHAYDAEAVGCFQVKRVQDLEGFIQEITIQIKPLHSSFQARGRMELCVSLFLQTFCSSLLTLSESSSTAVLFKASRCISMCCWVDLDPSLCCGSKLGCMR
jgi:hypothetical protein